MKPRNNEDINQAIMAAIADHPLRSGEIYATLLKNPATAGIPNLKVRVFSQLTYMCRISKRIRKVDTGEKRRDGGRFAYTLYAADKKRRANATKILKTPNSNWVPKAPSTSVDADLSALAILANCTIDELKQAVLAKFTKNLEVMPLGVVMTTIKSLVNNLDR